MAWELDPEYVLPCFGNHVTRSRIYVEMLEIRVTLGVGQVLGNQCQQARNMFFKILVEYY
jgi:hypothetical protein